MIGTRAAVGKCNNDISNYLIFLRFSLRKERNATTVRAPDFAPSVNFSPDFISRCVSYFFFTFERSGLPTVQLWLKILVVLIQSWYFGIRFVLIFETEWWYQAHASLQRSPASPHPYYGGP